MRRKTGIEQLQDLHKKPIKKLDRIVKAVLIYWVTFVALCFITFWIKGEEPVTLITYGLGGSAIELVITAIIEICRDKYTQKKEDKE